eukprot:3169513-Rhodomonas_salina.1
MKAYYDRNKEDLKAKVAESRSSPEAKAKRQKRETIIKLNNIPDYAKKVKKDTLEKYNIKLNSKGIRHNKSDTLRTALLQTTQPRMSGEEGLMSMWEDESNEKLVNGLTGKPVLSHASKVLHWERNYYIDNGQPD